jgi:hypothetical protein
MKLLETFRAHVAALGPIKRAWLTTFNIGVPFFETHVLPALLEADVPVNRMDYESLHSQCVERGIDLRVFCDLRMMEADQLKRTALPIHGVLPASLGDGRFGDESLFHPKVIFLEGQDGRMVLGSGSANLTVSGWGQNQEVFSFRAVSNATQYAQVKRFFKPLLAGAGLDAEALLNIRKRFDGDDPDWHFFHSFEHQTFLETMTTDIDATSLTVWSPYFSRDLAAFLRKVRELTGVQLSFAVVPDRVENRRVRTAWSEELHTMILNEELTFHGPPDARDERIALTHAKLWLASGRGARLGIGSWNCTTRGSASFERRNIEAGIVLDVSPRAAIAGAVLALGESDFSTDAQLDDEEPEIRYPLPFELQVTFDWEKSRYDVTGRWHEATCPDAYELRLPGMQKGLPLLWKARRSNGAWPLEAMEHELSDNEALLADHSYQVWRQGELVYRGLILETSSGHRRALGYDTLNDLLNDLVQGGTAGVSDMSRLRPVLRNDDLPDDDRLDPVRPGAPSDVSYFRMFHAFEQFRERLRAASAKDLDRLLFVQPGSLQELVSKVDERIAATGNTVFNWFLLQEVCSLHSVAQGRWDLRRRQPEKWRSLTPKSSRVDLPREIRDDAVYMRQLKEAYGLR